MKYNYKIMLASAFASFALSAGAYDFASYAKHYETADYREALNMGLKFFGGQRCGDTHNWMLYDNKNVTKKSCHTKDGQGSVNGGGNGSYDLTGGWHDCGDHIKVGTTMGSSAVSLLIAYDLWPKAFQDNYDGEYKGANGIPDVLDEAKVATDYFMKCFLPNGEFCYYVGSPGDHNVWMTSSKQSTQSVENGGDPRPVWTSSVKGGPQAANYVSALALMSIHYPDNDYKLKCKEAAISAYEFAKRNKSTHAEIPQFYSNPNTEWTDELSLAALLMHRLTGEQSYLDDALEFMHGKWESKYPLAWDTMTDYVYYYLVRMEPMLDNGGGGSYFSFMEKNVNFHLQTADSDPNGFPYYSSRWGTNKLALGGAAATALYLKLVEDEVVEPANVDINKAAGFRNRIVDYVLGHNEFNHTFLHGFKGDMTFRIHHRNAMGLNNNPPEYVKNTADFMFASGGVIGGPSGTGIFENIIEGGASYTETEGGCDYNAPFVAAIAGLVAQLDPVHSGTSMIERKTSFNVYPTQFEDYIVVDPIEMDYSGSAVVSLSDITGRQVLSQEMRGYTPVVLNTSDLPRGVYMVQVVCDGNRQTYKVVK